MKFWDAIFAVLGFRSIPTTVLLVLVYVAVFTTVLVTDELPDVPTNQGGLNISQAYADLYRVAARPHPYNSHSNELVHSYILSRVQGIASHHTHVHVAEDLVTSASWATQSYGVYFEGTNIMVKIDGTDANYQDNGGVLFSAHYDSVSTAPGPTDDGMGVVTLMQMVEYLAERRPKRTVIFNINNGEEDGLHGARVFMNHPWSNIPDVFLNLEGAASGGRPIVFRSTSKAPVLSFTNTYVPHPHGSVLGTDALSRGFIRSGTDFSIYETTMEGLDFAFYKGRDKYHTKYDSIPNIVGGEKALWAMMEAVRGAGSAMANDEDLHGGGGVNAVYFDPVMIVFELSTLFKINIVLLAAGPILLIALVYTKHVVLNRVHPHAEVLGEEEGPGVLQRLLAGFKGLSWLGNLWRLGKFWLALVVGIALQTLLVVGYVYLNPFIVYSHPYMVLTSTLSLAYLSIVLFLNIPVSVALPEQQKLTIMLQTYILTWLLLVASTVVVSKLKIAGLYLITAWNAVVLLGSAIGCLEGIAGGSNFDAESLEAEADGDDEGDEERVRTAWGVMSGASRVENEAETDPTETTPLIRQRRLGRSSPSTKGLEGAFEAEDGGALIWWILQLALVVPVPLILVSHIAVVMMGALCQTLADGSSPIIVYSAASLLSVLAIVPLAPFTLRLHRSLTQIILLIFIISTVYNWLAFPFSQETPLKVFFQQKLEIDLEPSGNVTRAVTTLTGVPAYINTKVIPNLPSAWSQERRCSPDLLKKGTWTCAWDTNLIPSPGSPYSSNNLPIPGAYAADWLTVNTFRNTNSTTAHISVKGTNTRSCRLFFNNTSIMSYHVHGTPTTMRSGHELPEKGVSEIRLWSRTWGKEFKVDLDLASESATQSSKVDARVACDWAEYQSATAGIKGSGGAIPAIEEALSFLPKWVVLTKKTDGLVETWGRVSI